MIAARNAAWFAGLLAAALLLLALSPLPAGNEVEARLGDAVAPVVGAVGAGLRPVTDVMLNAGQTGELSAENADLRQRLARAEADLASLREARFAREQSAVLIESAGAETGAFVTAAVVLRDPAPGRQSVILNRGRDDEVRPGQPVLGAGATLVGVVTEVDARRARVRLISDRDAALAVLVQSSRLPASLVGTGNGLRLDFVPVDARVSEGDVILSSALGGMLPPGLLVGRVSSVSAAPSDLFQSISVDPLGNLDRVEQVLVMTSFIPGVELAPALETEGDTP